MRSGTSIAGVRLPSSCLVEYHLPRHTACSSTLSGNSVLDWYVATTRFASMSITTMALLSFARPDAKSMPMA